MFKYGEKYLLSIDNKDIGSAKIYAIVSKKNSKLKKRIYKVTVPFKVQDFLK
ncbi:MAG: hypothetical protein IJ572_03265 [Bacilli bacterium]|nr:hypothetical protein [Bacilli bacterium]